MIEDSPIKAESKASMVDTAIALKRQEYDLVAKLMAGGLTSDEHRCLSGCCSNYRRVLESLRVLERTVDDNTIFEDL